MSTKINIQNLFILAGALFIIYYLMNSKTEKFSDYTQLQAEYAKQMEIDHAKACSDRAIDDAVNNYVFGGVKSVR